MASNTQRLQIVEAEIIQLAPGFPDRPDVVGLPWPAGQVHPEWQTGLGELQRGPSFLAANAFELIPDLERVEPTFGANAFIPIPDSLGRPGDLEELLEAMGVP